MTPRNNPLALQVRERRYTRCVLNVYRRTETTLCRLCHSPVEYGYPNKCTFRPVLTVALKGVADPGDRLFALVRGLPSVQFKQFLDSILVEQEGLVYDTSKGPGHATGYTGGVLSDCTEGVLSDCTFCTVRQSNSSSSWFEFVFCPCGEKVSNEGVPRSRGWVEESLRTIRLSSVSSRRASAPRTTWGRRSRHPRGRRGISALATKDHRCS